MVFDEVADESDVIPRVQRRKIREDEVGTFRYRYLETDTRQRRNQEIAPCGIRGAQRHIKVVAQLFQRRRNAELKRGRRRKGDELMCGLRGGDHRRWTGRPTDL